MSDVQWWPAYMLDEIMPQHSTSADAWIISHSAGFAIDADEPGNESSYFGQPQPLTDGEIVNFITCTDYGLATLSFDPTCAWSVDIPMPAEARLCCILGDGDTLGGNVDETVKIMMERGDEADDYVIGYYTYSNQIPLRFEQASRRFVAPGMVQ